MKRISVVNPWTFSEDNPNHAEHFARENFLSLGNGYLHQQCNFEEQFHGTSIHGSFVKGLNLDFEKLTSSWKTNFQPDKKIIINMPDWTPVIVRFNDETLDISTWDLIQYNCRLNIHEAFVERIFEVISPKGSHIQITAKRFLSIAQPEIAAISYTIRSLNFDGRISYMPLIEGNLQNNTGLANELQWNVLQSKTLKDTAHLWIQIKKADFQVATAIAFVFYKNNEQLNVIPTKIEKEKTTGFSVGTDVRTGDSVCLNKYIAVVTSNNYPRLQLTEQACAKVKDARNAGWNTLFDEHRSLWEHKWKYSGLPDDDSSESVMEKKYDFFKLNISNVDLNLK